MTRTADPTASETSCPPWCGQPCSGEHWQDLSYLPASGRAPYVRPSLGTAFPAVGVGLQFSPPDGDIEASVVIHLTGYDESGGDLDENVFLRPHEAEAVARELLDRVAVLRRTIGASACAATHHRRVGMKPTAVENGLAGPGMIAQ